MSTDSVEEAKNWKLALLYILSFCSHPITYDDMTPKLNWFPFYPVWSFQLLPRDDFLIQTKQNFGNIIVF